MKKIAILQSNYIPWKGYFDMIAAVDEFIIYDDMQYTKNDWRNRNKIKTPHGVQWLTIPVKVKGRLTQKIRDAELDGDAWRMSHWKNLVANYRKSNCFNQVAEWLEPLYFDEYRTISELNISFIKAICSALDIKTKISHSWDYQLADGKTERLVDLCIKSGGNQYISGPAAKDYIDESLFSRANIDLLWFDYEGYPEYPQLWGDFTHHVSILDLLFNCGAASRDYMRYVR